MAVADAFSDPQLAPATKGKPIDLAAAGFNDGIDWLNLPYLHPSRPVGGDAWQVTSLIGDTVEIVDPGPVHAVVRTTGHWTVDPNVSVETVYSLEPGQPYVTAETIFSNSGPSLVTAFTGDAIDVDDGATVSHVPGAGEITLPYESPGTFVPTDPWIAAYGAQAQTFGLVYTDDFAFEALANTNWIMSIGEITIPAGGETSFTRRIVAAPSTNAGDRAAPVREVWERIVLERTGLTASMSVDDDHVAAGDIVTASVVVENVGSDPVAGASVSFNPGIFTSLDPLTKPVGELPPGEQQTITFRARAQQGGSTTISTTLLLGSEAVSTKSAKIVVDGPGWYLGDNHTHSTFSDGSGTIAQNMASARSKGLSWLVATDHNTVDQRTQLAPEVRDDFVPMYGEEVTAGYGHSLAYNINSLIAAVSPPQTMLNNVNANNGGKAFLYIAHPYYPGLEWDDWNAIDGLRGIEVWNGFYPPKHVVNTSAFAKWDELNRAGRHLLGLANSDAHNPGKIGSPSIRAYLDELSETEVVQALATGGFYGTDGVDVRFTVNGVRMGGDVQVPPSGGPVSVDLSASHAPGIDAVRLYVDGSVVQTWTPASAAFDEVLTLQLMPGQFVRVEADGAGGRFAFSNPIWITAGDATIDAPVLARIVGATTEDVSLDWTGVAAATAYEIDEAPVPTDVVGSPTTNIDWSADVAGFSTDPAASTTSTLVFNTTGATVLAFDEVLDTEPAIDFATVTAISGDGTRSTLRRESGASGGTRAVALALPDGTVAVEFALPVDANEGGRDYSGWALTDLRIGSPTFIMVGSATETTNSLVGRSPGEYVYRVRALLIGGAEATSNLQPVVVAAPPPGPVVPEAPIVALLGLCAIGIFLLGRRRLLARA